MNVYVESNFILELAFQRDEYKACEDIWELARKRKISLFIPSVALTETFIVVRERKNNQKRTWRLLQSHLREIEKYQQEFIALVDKITDLINDLAAFSRVEENTFEDIIYNLLRPPVRIVEMNQSIIEYYVEYKEFWKPNDMLKKAKFEETQPESQPRKLEPEAFETVKEEPIDCLIFSFINHHCEMKKRPSAIFITKDKRFEKILLNTFFKKVIKDLNLQVFKSFLAANEFMKRHA